MIWLSLGNALLAVLAMLWLRRVSRARGQEIPCTRAVFSWVVVAAGVAVMFGVVVANVLLEEKLGHLLGREKSGWIFAAWLLTASVGSILFIVALTTFHTNRTAAAWIRVMPPGGFSLRIGGESTLVKLQPGAARVTGVAQGVGGILYVQYQILDGERAIDLVLPFVRGARTDGAPWLDRTTGLVVQGAARTLHELFAQFL
jgi:hypothetical protein